MNVTPEFRIAEVVYLKTDTDQSERIVTGFIVRESGVTTYEVSHFERCSWHYGFELSRERDIIKTTRN